MCIHRKKAFIVHSYENPTFGDPTCTPRPRYVAGPETTVRRDTQNLFSLWLLPLLLLLLFIMECVRPCRSTYCHPDETPSLLVLLQTAHGYPTPVSSHCYVSSSGMHADIIPRGSAPPNQPQVGCTRLAAVRLISKCKDMFSLVSDYCEGISPLGYWQKVNQSPTQTKPYNTLPPFEQRDPLSSYGAVRSYSEVLL